MKSLCISDLHFQSGYDRDRPMESVAIGIFPNFRVKFGIEKNVVLSNPEKALLPFLALTQTTNKSLGRRNC
jgi:hypothetical protein